MAPGDTALLYHRLTSLDPAGEFGVPRDDPRLLKDLLINDRATWPCGMTLLDSEIPGLLGITPPEGADA